jgi:hypothetical protein
MAQAGVAVAIVGAWVDWVLCSSSMEAGDAELTFAVVRWGGSVRGPKPETRGKRGSGVVALLSKRPLERPQA